MRRPQGVWILYSYPEHYVGRVEYVCIESCDFVSPARFSLHLFLVALVGGAGLSRRGRALLDRALDESDDPFAALSTLRRAFARRLRVNRDFQTPVGSRSFFTGTAPTSLSQFGGDAGFAV